MPSEFRVLSNFANVIIFKSCWRFSFFKQRFIILHRLYARNVRYNTLWKKNNKTVYNNDKWCTAELELYI